MIDIDDQYRELVKNVLRRHIPERQVRAFGSRVEGKAKPYSDLDLVILGSEQLPRSILVSLKDDFEESDIPFRIDILDWNRISTEFQNAIRNKSEPWLH